MTTTNARGIAVLAEVVAVLARHTNLRVTPVVEEDRGVVALTVRIKAEGEDGLQVLSLLHELQYVTDVAQVRAIAAQYNIDAVRLEALIPDMDDDDPPQVRHLTVQEIDAVVRVLTRTQPVHGDAMDLLESALPKLVQLGRAMEGRL